MTVTRLDVREASAHMLAHIVRLPSEEIPLGDALGRSIANDVVADVFLPPRDNASMDGFAIHTDVDPSAGESSARPSYRVVETIAAGQLPSCTLKAGEAARIMTGAYVPEGADSVIRIEDTDAGVDCVVMHDMRDAGRNIRLRGEDVRPGDVVVRAQTRLGAAHIGVLASVGCARPNVVRKPRVAILATGDELVTVEDFARVRAGDRIVSSNSYALAAAVTEAGGEPVSLGIAPDDPAGLAESLRAAEGCDLIVTCGGVSVGDFDYTRKVIDALGGELSLWRVKMRPGAPIGFGRVLGAPWLGLPGNPVSALVTFELFGRPIVRMMSGETQPHRRTIVVTVDEPVALATPLMHFLRVTLHDGADGVPVARLTGAQSSGMLTSMSAADALLIVPADVQSVASGTRLRAIPLRATEGGSADFLA